MSNMMDRSDRTFIVWIEGDDFRYKELLEVKPAYKEGDSELDEADFLKSILEQYSDLIDESSADNVEIKSDLNIENDY